MRRRFAPELGLLGWAVWVWACAAAPAGPASAVPPAPRSGAAARPQVAPTVEAAERALNESRYVEAEAGFRAFLSGPEAKRAQLGLARTLMITGRHHAARELLTLGLTANDLELATTWAECAWRSGAKPEAEQRLKVLVQNPAARRARLLFGEILLASGQKSEAEALLMTLIEDYNSDRITAEDGPGLALVGRAAYLLDSPHDANDAFNAAERAAPGVAQTLLWRAELFLDKHDPGHAEEVITELLSKAPQHPGGLVWMAHVKLEQTLDFDSARRLAEQALAIDPTLGHAYFVLAGLELRDLEFASALAAIERGLERDPDHLPLYSLRAAVMFLSDDAPGFEAARQVVFQKNPRYTRFYSIVGEYAEWEHRYERIVEMMREAVAIDDDDARAHAELGLNLIRAGQESAGLVSLRRAGAKDPFNVRVYNTLNLYEDIIAKQYVSRPSGHFQIRYPREEASLLERYVPALLEQAFQKLSAAYAFTPSVPIGIELYNEREHFAVRTSGLPQTSISGVCFGKTLASLTPRREPLNLGMTLWHELAHVFHIQMSDSHVPRWLTEGLAEYETLVERREWRRHHDPELYRAFRAKRLPALSGMNRAFSHAENMQDMATAYYASSQIAGLLVERFGRAAVNQVLRGQGRGLRTLGSLEAGLGTPVADLDAQFSARLVSSLGRYDKQFVPLEARGDVEQLVAKASAVPRRARALLELALAALRDGDLDLARDSWTGANQLDPKSPDVRFLGARLAAAEEQYPKALGALAELAKTHDGYAVQMALSELNVQLKQPAAAQTALDKAHAFDPTQAEPLQGLWQLARQAGDPTRELEILKRLAPLEAHNPGIQRRLLELLLAKKSFAEAVEWGKAALYTDIEGAGTHVAYAQALAGAGRPADAEFEFESALLCPTEGSERVEVHRAYAAFLTSRGQHDKATGQQARAAAIESAPAPAPVAPSEPDP